MVAKKERLNERIHQIEGLAKNGGHTTVEEYVTRTTAADDSEVLAESDSNHTEASA